MLWVSGNEDLNQEDKMRAPMYSDEAGTGMTRFSAPATVAGDVRVFIEYGAIEAGYQLPANLTGAKTSEIDFAGAHPDITCRVCGGGEDAHIWTATRRFRTIACSNRPRG
jgi:hypothetical protein